MGTINIFTTLFLLWTIVAAGDTCPGFVNSICPSNQALGISAFFDFDEPFDSVIWNVSSNIQHSGPGAIFEIQEKDSKAWLLGNFSILYGRMEFWMKSSNGEDVVTSGGLYSDNANILEWAITGENPSTVTTWASRDGVIYTDDFKVTAISNPDTVYHNYTIIWLKDKVTLYLDSAIIRTVSNFGDEPMYPLISLVATDYKEDWSAGNYSMSLANLTIEDATKNASLYTYGVSGNEYTINITHGVSPVAQAIIDANDVSNNILSSGSSSNYGALSHSGIKGASSTIVFVMISILLTHWA